MGVAEPLKVTHLAKDSVSWETRCGLDLTGTDTPITQLEEHATCEKCVPPKDALEVEEILDTLSSDTFDFYETEILDKAIYPEKGTGGPNALSYTLAGRVNELGEYVEKFLPMLQRSRDLVVLGQAPWPAGPAELQALEEFNDILRMMVAVGKRAHTWKKRLRRGEIRVPPFVGFTPTESAELDAEDGDTWWYQGAHTMERAGRRSWLRIIGQNILKLMRRKKDKKIEGDGDKR